MFLLGGAVDVPSTFFIFRGEGQAVLGTFRVVRGSHKGGRFFREATCSGYVLGESLSGANGGHGGTVSRLVLSLAGRSLGVRGLSGNGKVILFL